MREVVGEMCKILEIPHTEKIPKKYYLAGESFTVSFFLKYKNKTKIQTKIKTSTMKDPRKYRGLHQ